MKETKVSLRPVLALHGYCVDLPNVIGVNTYRFRVHSGDIEIRHNSYDGIVGLWCLPPESGDKETILLHSGDEAMVTIDSRVHDYSQDMVYVTNSHYSKSADFSYEIVEKEPLVHS